MAEEFKMPPMGQTSSSLTILQWHIREGDAVKQGDVLAEVETDKATLDIESYLAGTVLKILREEGDTVDVGEPIVIIGEAGEQVREPTAAAHPPASTEPATQQVIPTEPMIAAQPMTVAQPMTAGARTPGPGKVLASPVARKLAKDRGIDLTTVVGSGPGGRITKEDVLAAGTPPTGAGSDRSVVARRVARSFQTIPHVYLTAGVDMSLAATQLATARSGAAMKITYTHVILRAIGAALIRNPVMNGVWHDSGTPSALDKSNVGLVVAGGSQLAIVTIEAPGKRTLAEIAVASNGAVERVRNGALTAADFAPCAVSISNLGMFAIDEFHAIIDPDQSSMVSVGRISDRVVAVNDAIAIRPIMSITVAADHRVVDGVDVAAFLDDIKRILEEGGTV